MEDIPDTSLDTTALSQLSLVYISEGVSPSLIEKFRNQSSKDVKIGSTNCVFVFWK